MKEQTKGIITGVVVGIIAPPVAFYLFCRISFPDISVYDQLLSYIRRNVLTHVISLSVIINLALFFIFLRMNKEFISRGILGATFLYAFTVLILKLI